MGGLGHKPLFSYPDAGDLYLNINPLSLLPPPIPSQGSGESHLVRDGTQSLFLSSFPGPVNENNSDPGKWVSSADALSLDGRFSLGLCRRWTWWVRK